MMEIKPCPFCGSSEISHGEVLTEYPSGKVTTQSQCESCGALGAEAKLVEGEIDYGSVKAIEAWNRRATITLPDPTLPPINLHTIGVAK